MSHPESPSFEPRRPALLATAVFVAAMLTLCWPMLTGQFLVSPLSDQYSAGYAFREYAASYWREHRAIPLWNPYLFGGMPFIAAMHGDIFYPTAWLRWFLPTDVAMTLGFALHLVLAGVAMYAFLRALGASWTAALTGGLAYELSGIVASQVHPGHDGKLFVTALTPLLFLALLRAVRGRSVAGYAATALVVGLAMVSPHYQLTYYLLVAAGLWTLWLTFADPARPAGQRWFVPLGAALGAVFLGLAISAAQALPFLEYIPFSPRGAGGPSTGWDYATGFSMPLEELMVTILPQFNGMVEHYWGQNGIKLHTEYLGALVMLLAVVGLGDRERGSLRWALGGIGLLFLLIAFGRHTPFYRLWYEVMPMMKKVRAPGMAFFLVAFVTCAFAGFGADRLLRAGRVPRGWWIGAGVIGAIALLGALGGLQAVAEGVALPQQFERVNANAGQLQGGALRLLLAVLVAAGLGWAVAMRRVQGAGAAAALALVTLADLWSIDRRYFQWSPPAAQLYAEDDVLRVIKETTPPVRVMDFFQNGTVPPSVYEHSILMGHRIQQVFGYHGNEVRFYDELWGGKLVYRQQLNLKLWNVFGVRYLLLGSEEQIPGFTKVLGPVQTAQGAAAYLYEADSIPPYARVVAAAAKLPDSATAATVADPRFPIDDIVVLSDTASATPAPLVGGQLPARPGVQATVSAWAPGRMTVSLAGAAAAPTWLVVSETWYPGWQATVDGQARPVHRGDHAAITVELPPGAKQVELAFSAPAYERGKLVSLAALLLTAGLFAAGLRRRRADA